MTDKKRAYKICSIVVLCCVIMSLVDGVWQPHYGVKSAVKILLFLLMPTIYYLTDRESRVFSVLRANKKGMLRAICLCVPVYLIILGGYLLLKDVFDFSAVTGALTGNIGVNAENFVYVSVYISFVNSLLEEFFFRGFACLILSKYASQRFAFLFSAVTFALYHIAMMIGWFSVWVYAIIMLGLVAGGLIFNYLDSKTESIYTSWFVHAFANFAINTVGFMLFGII